MAGMVTCWSCNAQYASSIGKCPSCSAEYRPSEEETTAIAREEAFQLLKSGAKRADVQAEISSRHELPEQVIDDVMQTALTRVRAASNQHGRQIAGSGCALLAGAFLVLLITRGTRIAIGLLAFGTVMLIAGSLKAWTGWNMTGHDFE